MQTPGGEGPVGTKPWGGMRELGAARSLPDRTGVRGAQPGLDGEGGPGPGDFSGAGTAHFKPRQGID